MRSVFSKQIEPQGFLDTAAILGRRCGADLMLAAPGYSGQGNSLAGVRPCRELLVTETTSRDDIARFVFSDDAPVFGFLSYSYGMKLRGVVSDKGSGFPLGHLKKYDIILEYDRNRQSMVIYSSGEGLPEDIRDATCGTGPDDSGSRFSDGQLGFTQSIGKPDYMDKVNRTLEYIREGYTYQLNLSIKYSVEIDNLDALGLFLHLFRIYPAPFYAWFRSGGYRIVSTSPERFLQVRDGRVLSQPIKGTLSFDRYRDDLVRELTESPKESAELSMIVDLVRNDISLNCKYGSVRVDGHKSTFFVDNLVQMYSNVLGELQTGRTCLDLLLDALPGGSVTGCPKMKSMQIIDRLEPHTRDVYCGSFFVIRDQKNMDSSIAIRTGFYDGVCSMFHFFAGSGIVADSDPEREYLETVAKAEKFLRVLGL